jgi:hypothetical protein
MGQSLNIHKNLIRKEGDREVVGKHVVWEKGTNSLAEAFEKALDETNLIQRGTDRLRRNPQHEGQKRVRS